MTRRSTLVLLALCLVLAGTPWHAGPLSRLPQAVRDGIAAEPLTGGGTAEGPLREVTFDQLAAGGLEALHGRRVVIVGFALPVEQDEAGLRRVLLVRDAFSCCYGRVPAVREWVLATHPSGVARPASRTVRATGVLEVREKRDESGALIGLYTLRLDALGS